MHRSGLSLRGWGVALLALGLGFLAGRGTRAPQAPAELPSPAPAAAPALASRPGNPLGEPSSPPLDPAGERTARLKIDQTLDASIDEAYATAALWAEGQSAASIEKAVAELLAHPNSAQREFTLRGLAARWGEVDFEGARAFAEAQTSDERVALLNRALSGYAKSDPQAAWQTYLDLSGNGAASNFEAGPVIESIALADPDRAFACLQDLGGAGRNLASAFSGILNSAERNGTLDQLAGSIMALPEAIRGQVQGNYWRARGYYEGASAFYAIDQGTLNDVDRQQAVAGLIGGWGRYNGPEALEFIYANLSEADQQTYAPIAILEWLDHGDPDLVLAHLNEIPRDTLSDRAIMGIASKLAEVDGSTATDWATSLTNEKLRQEALEDIVWVWGGNDPGAMSDYLDSIADPDMKSSLAWDGLISITRHGMLDANTLSLLDLRNSDYRKRSLLREIAASLADPKTVRRNPASVEAVREYALNAEFLDDSDRDEILGMLGGS